LVTENAADSSACDAMTVDDQGHERPGWGHQVERVSHGFRLVDQHGALTEVVDQQGGHHEREPRQPDRLLAEMAHVGIEGLGAGHSQDQCP
jgi:hypothetical protein